MSHVEIKGEKYELPPTFTLNQAKLIKDESGLGIAEISEGLEKGDPGLISAMCQIATARAGKPLTAETLGEFELTDISFDFTDEEDAKDPEPPPSADPQPASGGSGGDATDANASGNPATTQATPGSPSGEISSPSGPATSAT